MKELDTIREAFAELISIVKIHSRNTDNNFAWAELPDAEESLAALSTIEAGSKIYEASTNPTSPVHVIGISESKPQEPREDAREFLQQITEAIAYSWENPRVEAAALITAHDDAIRLDCAKKARSAILSFGKGDTVYSWYSPMIRKDMAAQIAELVIIGTEPARVESRLASCPHCGTVIMENGYGAHHSASCPLIGTHFNIGTHVPAREEP